MWHRADSAWRDVHRQGPDSNDFLYSGARLGSSDQRSRMVREFVSGVDMGRILVYALNALIRGVTGYLLIHHPDAGASAVTMVLAVLFIVGGIFRVIGASSIQFPRWGWTAFAGVVSAVLGISLLIAWPAASTYFVGMAIGIDLVLDGGALLGFAAAIHSLPVAQTRTA